MLSNPCLVALATTLHWAPPYYMPKNSWLLSGPTSEGNESLNYTNDDEKCANKYLFTCHYPLETGGSTNQLLKMLSIVFKNQFRKLPFETSY